VAKKKNVRKSELERMANKTIESRSELDTIRDEQFKILVEAIS